MQTRNQQSVSCHDWSEFLAAERQKSFDVYSRDPNRLIADYRTELSTSTDYEGREILELLQNANDAAAEMNVEGSVLIELTPDGLIIANTGICFSKQGVQSLRLAHLSPKHRRKNLIGNKGLGFRAVLNWAKYPIVLSGNLRMTFSRKWTEQTLQELNASIPDLHRMLRVETTGRNELVLPVLTFPGFSESGDLTEIIDGGPCANILRRSMELKNRFETVIGMPFDQPNSFEKAKAQIELVGPEVLLFVQNLGELTINVCNQNVAVWRKDSSSPGTINIANAFDRNGDSTWRVFKSMGEVPGELLPPDNLQQFDYEIVVAIGNKASPGVLFSHFKTEVRFPFPLLCHASLELQANRQHPQDTAINRFIISKVAEFMAHVAQEVATPGSWDAAKLLARTADLDLTLVKFGFEEKLLTAARGVIVLPTISGALTTAKDAHTLAIEDASWLPHDTFGDIAASPPASLKAFFHSLNVPRIAGAEIRRRIDATIFPTIIARAKFIAGLINQNILPVDPTPDLLLDQDSNLIKVTHRVYFPPIETITFRIPEWLNLRFLNNQLRTELANLAPHRDQRLVQLWLKAFRIAEYSTSNLISALIAEGNKRIQTTTDSEASVLGELIRILFQIYSVAKAKGEQPCFPSDSSLRILNQKGKFVSARELYLGRGYEPFGSIIQDLYSVFAEEKLAADPTTLGLVGDACMIADFLCWVGAEDLPREVADENPPAGFLRFTLQHLKYPVEAQDCKFQSPSEMKYARIGAAVGIDSLPKILENAPAESILAWLTVDVRANSWRTLALHRGYLFVSYQYHRVDRNYYGELPSYARWLIANATWLPVSDTRKEAPKHCLSGERGLDRLFPKPHISVERFRSYNLLPTQINEALDRAGMLRTLEFLEYDTVYQALKELPERDPQGVSAKAFYSRLLQHADTFWGDHGPVEEDFKKNGRMWGRLGETKCYFPVSELRHVDFEGVPETLLRHLKLVDLRYRIGNKKVHELFSVQPVEKSEISKTVDSFQPSMFAAAIEKEFGEVKPFLDALRRTSTTQEPELAALRKLVVRICSEVDGSITFEGKTEPLRLRAWEWILIEDVAYIQEDPGLNKLSLENWDLANALGEICANIFRLESGTDFAQIVQCPKQSRARGIPKILGEKGQQVLEELKKDFEASEQPERRYEESIPASAVQPKVAPETPHVVPPPSAVVVIETQSQPISQPNNGQMQITPQTHQVTAPETRVDIRVHRSSTSGGGGLRLGVLRAEADPEFCEKKAMEFELSDKPKRFPVMVSQIRGYAGFGCDIVSFRSAEDRARFLSDPNSNRGLILRYIEVKGRSNHAARIQLKGNELTCAFENAEKFFLYRFYESEPGKFILAVLRDPLKESSAVKKILEINLEASEHTQPYELRDGIGRDFAREWDGQSL